MSATLAHRASTLIDPLTTMTTNRLVALSGTDTAAFAQAQFSCDISALRPGQWRFGAWLSARGRVRIWFELLRTAEDAFLLNLRDGDAIAVVELLRRFVLRARVAIEPGVLPDASPPSAADDAANFVYAIDADWRMRLPRSDVVILPGTEPDNETRRAEIAAGIARMPATLADTLMPAWLDAGRFGAVGFKKGCYPGQEIVARMHYRGGNTRRLVRVAVAGATDPSAQPLRTVEGTEAGVVLSAVAEAGGHVALAVLRDDIDSAGLCLETGAAVEVLSASWAEAV